MIFVQLKPLLNMNPIVVIEIRGNLDLKLKKKEVSLIVLLCLFPDIQCCLCVFLCKFYEQSLKYSVGLLPRLKFAPNYFEQVESVDKLFNDDRSPDGLIKVVRIYQQSNSTQKCDFSILKMVCPFTCA